MRDFDVTVIADGCAARSEREHDQALDNIREMANAHVVASRSVRLAAKVNRQARGGSGSN
jgi:nicotinamidase-related amidase